MAGILHPSFPDSALVCISGSHNGDLTISATPCQISPTNPNNTPNPVSSIHTIAVPYHQTSLSAIKHSTNFKQLLGLLGTVPDQYPIHIYAIASSLTRPDILIMGTNVGIITVNLTNEAGGISCTGARHVNIGKDPVHGPFVGGGEDVVVVKDSSLYIASLTTASSAPTTALSTSASNKTHINPIGHIHKKDPILVYKSPKALHKSIDFQSRPVRLPPKLLPSPSGKFLCLFWQAEDRYEILHVKSMTDVAKKIQLRNHRNAKHAMTMGVEEDYYAPAVDSASNILSFAWVSDQDVFSILHPPLLSKVMDTSSKGDVTSRTIKNDVTKLILKSNTDNLDTEDENARIDPSNFQPRVELKVLVATDAKAAAISGSFAAATATIIGDLSLRGQGRHTPTKLFGGPVLCVASLAINNDNNNQTCNLDNNKSFQSSDGMAYFYSHTPYSSDGGTYKGSSSSFTSVGPPLPYPDLVTWDDDGRVCALFVGRRIAIYVCNPPDFTLAGTALLGASNEVDATVLSAKFLHGTLFCCTRSTVQCVFLGDMKMDDTDSSNQHIAINFEVDGQILASPSLSLSFGVEQSSSFEKRHASLILNHPSIIAYFHGSLLISTVSGLKAISLSNPLVRIGTLLSAGFHERAKQWFHSVPRIHHESLAIFLERRGVPDMALQLPGLSLETLVDFCLRFGFTDFLENLIETHGIDALRRIDGYHYDLDNSSNSTHGYGILVSIGTYLLSQGKAELVRRITTECMASDEGSKREAFLLAGLLLAVDRSDAKRLVKRAVARRPVNNLNVSEEYSESRTPHSSWSIGTYVRNNLLD